MSRRVDVNRLSKDELAYELTWRGIAVGTVDEMRGRLVLARQMEKTGESLHYPTYPFTFSQDTQSVTNKLDNLCPLVDGFSGNSKDSEFLKLQSKLNHALNRIDNMNPVTNEEGDIRGVLLAEALSLIDRLNHRATDLNQSLPTQRPVPLSLCVLQNSIAAGSSRPEPLSSSSPLTGPPPSGAHSSFGFAPILPHKWNIKFSGDKRGMSVTAFFERVEELRAARGVSKPILLNSGIDLFEGRAYEFFQDCRSEVTSWDELVQKFKEEYQPVYYTEKLLEEIKRRTQGPDETIGTYMAVMSRYFQRLECPVSEEAKLTILLRNISPVYKNQLGALEITHLAQLKTLCKRIEQRMQSDYVPPTRKSHSLEPDLAYMSTEPEMEERLEELRLPDLQPGSSRSMGSGHGNRPQPGCPKKEIVCFRCNKPGHRAIGCVEPRKLACFGCKKEGFTKRTCPNCNQGNGNRHS